MIGTFSQPRRFDRPSKLQTGEYYLSARMSYLRDIAKHKLVTFKTLTGEEVEVLSLRPAANGRRRNPNFYDAMVVTATNRIKTMRVRAEQTLKISPENA